MVQAENGTQVKRRVIKRKAFEQNDQTAFEEAKEKLKDARAKHLIQAHSSLNTAARNSKVAEDSEAI